MKAGILLTRISLAAAPSHGSRPRRPRYRCWTRACSAGASSPPQTVLLRRPRTRWSPRSWPRPRIGRSGRRSSAPRAGSGRRVPGTGWCLRRRRGRRGCRRERGARWTSRCRWKPGPGCSCGTGRGIYIFKSRTHSLQCHVSPLPRSFPFCDLPRRGPPGRGVHRCC